MIVRVRMIVHSLYISLCQSISRFCIVSGWLAGSAARVIVQPGRRFEQWYYSIIVESRQGDTGNRIVAIVVELKCKTGGMVCGTVGSRRLWKTGEIRM